MSKNQQRPWDGISDLFRSTIRRPEERKIGVEIERIGMWLDGNALHYGDRKTDQGKVLQGAETLLQELYRRERWEKIEGESGRLIGFSTPLGKVSLEPGSQLEFSSLPANDLIELDRIVDEFEAKVDAITEPWGVHWIGLGVNPVGKVEEMDVIASPRYHIMTDYLGRRDTLGTTMMRMTSSVQINLDYTSEAEAIEMLRVAFAVAPVSYALFANSPILHRKDAGRLSYRQEVWKHTDPDRSGILHEVFDDGFNFDSYAELVWKRPLMFAQAKDKSYVAAEGKSLADIAAGAIPNTVIDENNQLNAVRELFTEARIKPGYVEVRSIDGLRPKDRFSAIAFWLGLLYDSDNRKRVLSLFEGMTSKERETALNEAGRTGLKTVVGKWDLKKVACELLSASRKSLERRGLGEERFLKSAIENIEGCTCPGEKVLNEFKGAWKGAIEPLIVYSSE